jgi:predicted O-linked N-acetylglucosamine transferase (SPINDLY family)
MQISIDNPVLPSIVDGVTLIEHRSLQSIEFYESAISTDETIVSNYWYLGLSYLLVGNEDDARSAWFIPFAEADNLEVDIYTNELLAILEQEATSQNLSSNLESALLIRQHLWVLDPARSENVLKMLLLSNSLNSLTIDRLTEWQIDKLLVAASVGEIDDDLLEHTIAALVKDFKLDFRTDLSLNIIKSCLRLIGDSQPHIVRDLLGIAFNSFHKYRAGIFSVKLAEICQSFLPNELAIYQVLASLYSGVELHSEAITIAEQHYERATNHFEKLFGSYLIQRSYLNAGNWKEYQSRLDLQRGLQCKIMEDEEHNPSRIQRNNLIISSFFTPYIEDNPRINRPLQNRLARIYQKNLNQLDKNYDFEELPLIKKAGVLRIGYLASTLKEHSVGWLSRWLFHYHDRESFQIFNYCINQTPDNTFNHQWFRDKVDISYYLNSNSEEIAAQIKADEIDILIDLDSLTYDMSCLVMAHKPAPVQVTWLGLDASGIPAIDYFIADPYVLPNDAQDYYQEKIWRLPQTYLAVDGFELGIPTLNRQKLDIPDDAVVYFSSQGGYKRHPDNVRAQMQIIKGVPNSYLLIKGKSDPTIIKDFFGKIAEEEGVDFNRLRFLPGVPDEPTHRANLAIADIVLDTFPYNGATTTLETLWMGIPMVTQVGQQFAARNSYTFMMNAGIEEGIAWSQAEYVEWGIKLGLDRALRDKIQGKLRSGRADAPVWNSRKFTLEMEQAYRDMWAKYQEKQLINSFQNTTIINTTSIVKIPRFCTDDLAQISSYYESMIAAGDTCNDNYWYLGIVYLLQEREIEAQATWFIAFEVASELESLVLTSELANVLDRFAAQEFATGNLDNTWLISQHLREIDSSHLNNLFRSILLEIKLDRFSSDLFSELQAVEVLADNLKAPADRSLLAELLKSLLAFPSDDTANFIKICLTNNLISDDAIKDFVNDVRNTSHRIGVSLFVVEIIEFCRKLQPRNFTTANILCRTYSDMGFHDRAIDVYHSICESCDNLLDKIQATYTVIIIYLTAGNWKQANLVFEQYQKLIENLVAEEYAQLDLATNQSIIVSNVFLPYTHDLPEKHRELQNKIAKIYLDHNQVHIKNYQAEPSSLIKPSQTIRIGYVGSTLRSHSVGWLSRWLLQYHDRKKFQVFTYCINQNINDPFYQQWFGSQSDVSYCMLPDGERVAAQIRADRIDILVDVDSLTLDTTCRVLAAKPAPVQVSWLGWDATGLSTVDYFLADRYVLPENAQDYYQEKIWRLPQSYLAVKGFEIGIPTLSRQDLDISDDAVVYWSGQRGFKRHPDTVRAQMRILKSVPSSYFIIKGDTDPTIIQEFFGEIAAEEGVDFDRLRFVGNVADEPTHRANLAIADVVLDTFPYNGATTTLETLWMGIPMVTQVGQQFAARNSYTFMLNAGIEEGIAWSQEEYIEWGIKLGLDRELRDKIAGKLRSGRTTAPVWNAKQFTLDMEDAYRQMWAKYQAELN